MVTPATPRTVAGTSGGRRTAVPATGRKRALFVGLTALVGLAWFAADRLLVDRRPIVVGILHSQTGSMAVSEQSLADAEVLALEEINRAGGLLGRPVRWVIADGGSDEPTFARQAERLIREEHVSIIFGCWTSASRRSVLPVVESANHLLVYPMASEGLEQAPNVVFTGAAPNQQVTPAVQWSHDTLSARRFLLVGTDSIRPHCINAIAADQIAGVGDEIVAELYVPPGSSAVEDVVRRIVDTRPDVVLCSLAGDSAIAFFSQLRTAGVGPEQTPVITVSQGEDELGTMAPADMAGHYAVWGYFQSIDDPENLAFVRAFKARYGDRRPTSDGIATAYDSVRLWAQAVREAQTADPRQVRHAMRHQSIESPAGIIAIDPETQYTWRPVFIGCAQADGQFDIVWTSRTAVRPVPFPLSRSLSAWKSFVDGLRLAWHGGWAAPAGPPSRLPGAAVPPRGEERTP